MFSVSVYLTSKIYNLLGQLVRTLVNEEKFGSAYQVMWDGKDQKGEELSSSIYLYKLKVEDQKVTRKMLLLKSEPSGLMGKPNGDNIFGDHPFSVKVWGFLQSNLSYTLLKSGEISI